MSSTSRQFIPLGDSSFAVRSELPSHYGAVTTAFLEINNRNGDNLFTASITAFADAGGGSVTVTSAAHGLASGDKVTISGTTNYDGTYTLTAAATNTFTITATWVADDATGDWEAQFACAPKAISTLGSAATAGADTLTLGSTVTTAPTSGDLIQVRANTGGPAETFRVVSYATSTKVVTVSEYVRYAHASGATVYGRWLTDAIDFSDTDAFAAGDELVFRWTGLDADGVDYQTTGEIMRASIGGTDLRDRFRVTHAHYWQAVSEDWTVHQDAALQELRMMFAANKREIDTLVDVAEFEGLWCAQIAFSAAWTRGDVDESERASTRQRRDELFDLVNSLPLWMDSEQDGIETDEETDAQDRPWPRRLLR
jgi:hypothetical protein